MLWKKASKGILTCGTETKGARCGRPLALLLAPPPVTACHPQNALSMLFIRCARAVCSASAFHKSTCCTREDSNALWVMKRSYVGRQTSSRSYRTWLRFRFDTDNLLCIPQLHVIMDAQMRYLLSDCVPRLRYRRTTVSAFSLSLSL